MSRNSNLPSKLAAIGFTLLGATLSFASTTGWQSPNRVDPVRLVDAIEDVNGVHPGFRRNHPKGICLVGWLESNGQGAAISHASVFRPGRFAVIGRFSTGARQPEAPDRANVVRSMALSVTLPDGEVWRTAMNSAPVFQAKDAQALHEHLVALKPDPATGKPDPARLAEFLKAHPESARALALMAAAPVSSGFANAAFNSIHAFRLVDADGKETAVRWSLQPVDPFEPQAAEMAQERHHLFESLVVRLRQGPVRWRLILAIGQSGDPTNDATQPWPADRRKIDAGTLTVVALEREEDGSCRDIVFDPLALPSGIEPSDDPLLSARSTAYAISASRRTSERQRMLETAQVGEKAIR